MVGWGGITYHGGMEVPKLCRVFVNLDPYDKQSPRRTQVSMAVVLNLGPPDVLGLQLPKILVSTTHGEGFLEF